MKSPILIFLCIFILQANIHAQQNCPSAGGGLNFSGRNLIDSNFTSYPANALVGANFTNAKLNGAQFQNVNLTNANFSGAIMQRSPKGVTDLSGATLDHTCFQKTRLDSANLQFVIFKATDFSNATLLSSDFGPVMTIQGSGDGLRTKFNGTTTDFNHFPINNWPAAYWSYTDLSNSRISGMNSQNFSFRNKDITGAILQGLNFTNFNFRHCIMSSVDFTGATLNYALMDSSTMDRVKLVLAKMNYTQLAKVSFYNPTYTGKSADFSGAVLNNATIRRSNFTYANLQGAALPGVTADSCVFDNANFQSGNGYSVAFLPGAVLSNSTFRSAQLNGVDFSNSYIINGQFNNLTLLSTNFSGATMPQCNFQNSVLEGVIFKGAILQSTNFSQCTMKISPTGGAGVDFTCTQLGGANFANAIILQANFSDAVMPTSDLCCKTLDGYYCGIIAINQLGYGAITFPVLNNNITCPNGDFAKCTGSQWELPGWRSANCNSQHVTQILWYKPNCGGHDTTGIINFPDPNLQASIFNQMSGGNPDYVITKNAAAQVVSLNCPSANISNLDGLQYFTSLQQLNLSGNKLVDGTFFTRLPTLHSLNVSGNQLSILNLQGLSALNVLNASNNKLVTVLLDASSYLNYLDVSYNSLSQMDITVQNTLNYVDMSNNLLTSVGNLSNFSSVNSIYLQNNSLTQIGNLANIFNNGQGNLLYMNISCNLPFLCNTLGLSSTPAQRDFLTHSLCGVNDLPGCHTSPKNSPSPNKTKQNVKTKNKS
ncbi:MAG: pentapeptide repeat-containing protein [Saprospiraceae bacterium]